MLYKIVKSECRHFTKKEWKQAAAELAAMKARLEKLEKVRKAAQSHMDFHGKDRGISKTNDTLLDALDECGK